MDLRQMEYVVAVAEERNFTRAAELAGISQSGLSSAIRSLEEELGAPLFERTTRRVTLTDAGLALLPHARQMLSQAATARDAVATATHEVTGSLHVGSEQCLSFVNVSDLLERFHRRNPRVDIQFTQSGSQDLLTLMRSHTLDVAFVASTKHLGSLRHRTLGEEPLVLLTAPDHPLTASLETHAEVSWAELNGLDFIDFTPSWGVRDINDETLAAEGVSRKIRCTVNDVHTLLDLVGRGLGVAIVPRHVAAKPQATGLRMFMLPLPQGSSWAVSVVSNLQNPVDAPAAHFLELLERCDEAAAPSAIQ